MKAPFGTSFHITSTNSAGVSLYCRWLIWYISSASSQSFMMHVLSQSNTAYGRRFSS